MEELAKDVAPHGEAAPADEAEYLAVDGEPCPAEHEGRHSDGAGHLSGDVAEAPDAGGELDEADEEHGGPAGVETEAL